MCNCWRTNKGGKERSFVFASTNMAAMMQRENHLLRCEMNSCHFGNGAIYHISPESGVKRIEHTGKSAINIKVWS